MTEPCVVHFAGRIITDWCEECGHMLVAHKRNHVCAVCEAAEQVSRVTGT
jgi:uncharacterized Zn finger protein (UPF0148 family)